MCIHLQVKRFGLAVFGLENWGDPNIAQLVRAWVGSWHKTGAQTISGNHRQQAFFFFVMQIVVPSSGIFPSLLPCLSGTWKPLETWEASQGQSCLSGLNTRMPTSIPLEGHMGLQDQEFLPVWLSGSLLKMFQLFPLPPGFWIRWDEEAECKVLSIAGKETNKCSPCLCSFSILK